LENRSYGYGSVCVPGLAAGLWTAHQKWGEKPWAETVQPAITLARAGFRILPKSHEFFEESEKKLKRGDAEIARLYLPNGQLPVVGTLLPNEDLARTMELFARYGRDGFYRGPVAAAIVKASSRAGECSPSMILAATKPVSPCPPQWTFAATALWPLHRQRRARRCFLQS
jgi:gamma-glutamyltranspeptidase/glutathione hydrolase